jgi:hypothetical protein
VILESNFRVSRTEEYTCGVNPGTTDVMTAVHVGFAIGSKGKSLAVAIKIS